MTIPLERKILHLGWPVAGSIIITLVSVGMWGGKFLAKQEEIYEAVTANKAFQDSVLKWHQIALVHRNNIDGRLGKNEDNIGQINSKVNILWDAMNLPEQTTLVTERKYRGRLIFEKARITNK